MNKRDYIIKRLILLIPVAFGASLITFTLSYSVGDPIAAYLGEEAERLSDEQIESARSRLGLDRPIYIQYLEYIIRLFQGDWGTCHNPDGQVLDIALERFPATAELSVVAVCLAILLGIPLGIISAIYKDQPIDHVSRIASLTGVSLPVFWLGMIMQFIIGFILGLLPWHFRISTNTLSRHPLPDNFLDVTLLGIQIVIPKTGFYLIDSLLTLNFPFFIDALQHIIMPAFALSWITLALISRMTRTSMLETMKQDYITLARSKGLTERVVIYRHALKNAMIPTLTISGLAFAGLLTGAVLTETVFDWPGMGSWVTGAIANMDLATIQGFVLISAIIYVLMNLFVDMLYGMLDPRIRYD